MTDDDPTGWFEKLDTDAAGGGAAVPWDRTAPGASLVAWADGRDLNGVRTLMVGCGYGRDSEPLRSAAIAAVGRVAPGGLLVAVEFARAEFRRVAS